MNNKVAALQKTLADANVALAKAEAEITRGATSEIVEQATRSAEDKIRRGYDEQIDKLTRIAAAQELSVRISTMSEAEKTRAIDETNAALRKQVEGLKAASDAAVKAQQESHRVSNAQSGREVTADQAAAIARSAGLQVNSASRSYADQKKLYDAWVAAGRPKDNPVAAPGTSAHEGAHGRWALDIQLANGVTPELLRKIFAAQGVSLSKVFLERGHFHIEGSRSQADAEATAADKAEQAALREQQDYQNRLASLMGAEIDARRALVTNPQALAALQRQEIETERKKYDANLDSLVAEGKLQGDHAAQLKAINDETAKLRLALVDRAEGERKLAEQQAAAERAANYRQAQIGQETELLRGQEDLARTQDERRAIEHRLLDLQFQQEKIQNDLLIAYAKRLEQLNLVERLQGLDGVDPETLRKALAAADEAQLRNAALPGRQAQATARSDLQTAGPLEAYLAKQPRGAAAINERVQGYVVDELEAVRQGIDNAITSAIGVKDPLLAGLIDLLVQTLLIDPLAEVLQKRAAAGGGGGGIGGFLSKVLGLAGHALGGGVSAATASRLAPDVTANIAANPGLFASGTPGVPVGRWFGVGDNGTELMRYWGGNRLEVMGNAQTRRFVSDGGGGPSIGHVTINIPERADPRRTATTVNRGLQTGLARAARKGLAAPAAF